MRLPQAAPAVICLSTAMARDARLCRGPLARSAPAGVMTASSRFVKRLADREEFLDERLGVFPAATATGADAEFVGERGRAIGHLNGVPKNELTAINQYFLHAKMLVDWGMGELGELEMQAIPPLREAIAFSESVSDYVGRELFEAILESEEEHVDWLETQLELIGKTGITSSRRCRHRKQYLPRIPGALESRWSRG